MENLGWSVSRHARPFHIPQIIRDEGLCCQSTSCYYIVLQTANTF